METLNALFPRDRYSARKMSKPINFVCRAPEATQVFLAGEFNQWDPASHPMARQADGAWMIQVPLCHGHHQYQFLVDGQGMLDPKAQGVARNARGERVSLLSVS
jgi:1,4-alpha-glucan branching enzyme